MHDLPTPIIVLAAILAALGLCAVIGGLMFACSKPEPTPAFEKLGSKIPEDRDFCDLETSRAPSRPEIQNPVFGRFESPTFPKDASYQSIDCGCDACRHNRRMRALGKDDAKFERCYFKKESSLPSLP